MSASPAQRRELFQLAWPASFMMVVQSLYRLNDQLFVKGLGTEAQSAVAVGGMVGIWFLAFAQLVAIGNLAVSSRRLGEGRTEQAHATIRTSLLLSVLVGGLLAMITVSTLPYLGEALIPGAEARAERTLLGEYLFWIATGQVIMVTAPCVDASFLALRDSRTPMLLQFLAITCNALLNWQLVPIWGVAGAGIASVVSRALPLSIGLLILRGRGVALLGPTSRAIAAAILRVGLPACAAIAIYSGVYQVMLWLTFSHFDAGGRSALGIGFGVESVFYCFYFGIATAVASLVGRHLGAGRPEAATAIARLAMRFSLAIGLLTSLIFWWLGPFLVGLFAGDEPVQLANVQYLRLLSFSQPFQAVEVIYEQAMIGAGASLPIMVSTGVLNLARIPLSHLLAVMLGFGLPGIWWAINLTTYGKFIWARRLFRRGRWRAQRV